MKTFSLICRQACRENRLPDAEKTLLFRLFREMTINTVRRQKAWQLKEDFLTLWFISAGRYPEFVASPFCRLIVEWFAMRLPFELTKEDQRLLWT